MVDACQRMQFMRIGCIDLVGIIVQQVDIMTFGRQRLVSGEMEDRRDRLRALTQE